ncbi:MAG: carbohydrate ABC transporter permease [Ruminiclostridium sp.]
MTKISKNKVGPGKICLRIILVLWAFIQLFPLLWLFTFSLKDNQEIFGGNIMGLPQKWLWKNYEIALSDANVGRYFFNSIFVTFCTIVLTTIISMLATYALTRMKWRLSKSVLMILMLGLMIPIHAAILPIMLMLKSMHILSSYLALIIPYTAFAIPMTIMIFTGFIKGIPREMEEAAFIDGCNIYGMFLRIILPLMRPAAATAGIFTFLNCWNELMFAILFINNSAYKTLTAGIQSMAGQYNTEWGPIGAALSIATFPTIIIYALLSKQVQKSLVMGAVKG